jgi:hypothetical protein
MFYNLIDLEYSFTLNDKPVTVQLGKDVFPSVHQRLNLNKN